MADSVVPRLERSLAPPLQLPVRDWKRLNALLAQALAVEHGQRAAWLIALPPENCDLVPVLERLLARADASSGMGTAEHLPRLGSSTLLAPANRTAAAQEEAEGMTIGPYRLVRELGVGGMGSVWLARRTDGAFEREVALKLPRAEWTDRGLAERLARERAALAALNHPNIAQMYEAGWASDGRPYLALEYVVGEPIDVWCTRGALAPDARVRLFVEVVRAVAFAHAKLVIHRDLKPSNVMITAEGHVKLLDFGIAKLLSADTTLAEETALTRLSGRALTLAYAAPEQVLGQPVSTAADTYALGVMLFELLTGTKPYRPARDSRAALEEAIVSADAPRPSSVAADRALARALRGDIDAIVHKALRKRPEDRYETAAAFADDLERHLAQQRVNARPDSRSYRARTFVRRNRLALGVSTGLAATLLVGAGVALWQADAAREEAMRAGVIKDFVLSMIRQADPMAGAATQESDLALLTAAERRIAEELVGQPEVAIELRLAIADAYANRGLMDRARVTLTSAIREGEDKLKPRDPRLAHARIKIAQNFVWLNDDVLTGLDLGIAVARSLGNRGHRMLVEGLINRGRLRTGGIDYDVKGEQDLAEAYDLARNSLGAADVLTLEAACVLVWPSLATSDKLQVIEAAYRAGRADPRVGETHPALLRAQVMYGYHLARAGRVDEGVALIDSAIETARRHHGESRPTEEVLASAQLAYSGAGQEEAALEAAREALRLAMMRVPGREPIVLLRAQNFVFHLLDLRRPADAEPVVTRFWPKQVAHPVVNAVGLLVRGRLLLLQGAAAEAEAVLGEAVLGLERRSRDRDFAPRIYWAWALRENGAPERSIEVLRALDSTGLRWDGLRRELFNQLGAAHLELGDAAEALRFADAACAGTSAMPTTPDGADCFLIRGRALVQMGRESEAVAALDKSDAFWRRFDAGSPWAAEASYWLSRARLATNDAGGRRTLDAARVRLANSPMPRHRRLASAPTPAS